MKKLTEFTGAERDELREALKKFIKENIPPDCVTVLVYQSDDEHTAQIVTNLETTEVCRFLIDTTENIAIHHHTKEIARRTRNS